MDEFGAHAAHEVFDPATGAWSTAPEMPEARNSYAAGAVDDLYLVAGGGVRYPNNYPPRYDTLLVFDATAGEWSYGPSLPEGAREQAGASLKKRFYVFGGFDVEGISADVYALGLGDGPGPAITCPASVTAPVTAAVGCELAATVIYPSPTAGPGAIVTCAPASGSVFPLGTTAVTCTASDADGNVSTCGFTVTVTGPAGTCAADDAKGDVFFEVVDRASPLYGFWRYEVAATGEVFCGTANSIGYRPGVSLSSSDGDDPAVSMTAQINYLTGTAAVKVVDRRTGATFVLRDRNVKNSVCQ